MVFVFYDRNGRRYEFSNKPENCVAVKLRTYFWSGKQYKPGDVIVVPREVAEKIDCEVLKLL